MALPLTKTGRYQIVRELGRGAMGVVYQGFDPVIGRTVAIKTMRPEGLSSSDYEEYKGRFQREAQAAGALSHPNIVTIHDFGEDQGVLYLAMEFLKGISLQELVDRQKALPIETIIPLYEQVSSALDHAHAHQVVHRDIKPANIMLLDSGLAKVTDFGIARVLSSGTGMTRVGQVVGTPSYMSPEQIKGLPVDGRSDIFSLGVILYILLTGRKPFDGTNLTTVIYKIVHEEPVSPIEIDKNIHPNLCTIVSKALAKDPSRRYQTCRELSEDLKHYQTLGQAAGAGSGPTAVFDRPGRAAAGPASPVEPPAIAKPQATAAVKGASPAAPVAPALEAAPRRLSPLAGVLIVGGLALAAVLGGFLLRTYRNSATAGPSPSSSPGTTSGGPPTTPAPVTPSPAPAGATSQTPSKEPSQVAVPESAPAAEGAKSQGSFQKAEPASPKRAQTHPAVPESSARLSHTGGQARSSSEKAPQDSGKTQPTPPVPPPQQPARQVPQPAPAGSPAQQTAASAPATSQVIVETVPPGYDVFIDGQGYGRSDQPVVANISVGKHLLTIKKGGEEVYRKSFEQTSEAHSITVRPPH
jgi:tRNA A-37 threonylcarbamoyl transferase component Bud32